ncbi:MAG: zinc ribbon domain-containing protein [Ruminococcaceae bacterium]|nr:zinc ribbon domain-containing protein [Oscillospiraceae bacterium]
MKCKYCGYDIEANDLFCTNCGKQVEKTPTPPPAPKKKTSVSTILAIIFGFLSFSFFIGLIMMSSEANSDGTDSPNKLWGADISMEITGFSNTDGNGNLISDELISGEMRYLTIDYKLEWIAEKPDSPLYLAIYNSEGNVEDQSTSDGRRWFVRTDGYTLDMPLDEGYRWVAWNWMYGKSETPYGNYRVEFWYEGEIIATDTVYIYP